MNFRHGCGRVEMGSEGRGGEHSSGNRLIRMHQGGGVEDTQWCRFLSQEVREISRFFVAPPMRVRPRPPRDISRTKFKFLLINLHH